MKKLFNFRLLVLIGVLITSVSQIWADTSNGQIYYFKPNSNWTTNGNEIFKMNFGGSHPLQMTQIGSTGVYWVKCDGSYSYFFFERYSSTGTWWNNTQGSNSNAYWNGTNNYFEQKADTWDGGTDGNCNWGVYRPAITGFTLAKTTSPIIGGDGSYGSPYLVLCEQDITLSASSPTTTVSDPAMTVWYDFKDNNTSKQKSATTSYTLTTSSSPNTTHHVEVYGFNRYNNGDGDNTKREFYFKTVQYYVNGNGNVAGGGNWCGGTDWGNNAMTYDTDNEDWYITFNNVAISNNLIFAIHNGGWADSWRHAKYNSGCSTNLSEADASDGDHNVKLTITEPSNITIRFTPSGSSNNICASAVGLYNGLAVAISDENAASTPTISASYTTSDEPVTITAYAANTGYTWAGWTANGGSITSSSSLITTWSPGASNKTATANYTEHISTITINTPSATEGSLNTTGSKSLGKTTTLALTATPADGYVFDHWTTSGVARLTTSTTTNPTTVTTDGTNGGTGSVTAVFKPRYVLRGSLYSSDTPEGMPGWGTNDFGFAYANSEWSVTTNSLTKSTKYKFKIYDRKESTYLGIDTETQYTNEVKGSKAFSSSNAEHGWFNSTFAGPYKFVLDKTNMKITITFNSKTLPDYSGKSVTQALNSAASEYVIGSGTSSSHYKIYQTMSSDHGKVDLTMDYNGVTTAHDGIWYIVGDDEISEMTDDVEHSKATVTMSMSTSAGNYSPAIKAYGKVDDQYNLSYAANLSTTNLYYDVIATPTLEIALKNSSDVDITSTAGLEVGQSIKIVPTLSGEIRDGSYVTYSYRISGSSDAWTTIATTQATNSAYTWSSNLPTEPNIYTIKAIYEDLGITVEATQDIVYWKDYTIYVWETGQDLATANQNANKVHEYYKNNQYDTGDPARKEQEWASSKALTDKSTDWGGGWHSFSLKWPLYNYFIINYNASSDDNKQSKSYYLGTKPENLYLQCNYSSSGKWTWGASAIEEPQAPSITITEIRAYSTKLVVDVKIDNNYSLLTTHSITINGEAQDGSRTPGSISNISGGTYRYTLNGLDENTEYAFRASATNALGVSNAVQTLFTLAKMPITMTIKVSSNLMKDIANYWGHGGTTTIGVKYWAPVDGEGFSAGFSGTHTLTRQAADDGYWWYECEFDDSPVSFYVYNDNVGESSSGTHRSANYNNASANACTEVQDDRDGNDNHVLHQPAFCGTTYKLAYYNGSTTTYSNTVDDVNGKMSLFIGARNNDLPAGRWLKLFKYTTSWDGGTAFTNIPVNDSAVYVVSINPDADINELSISDLSFEKYTGNYYIRTDKAPGGWNNYKGSSNMMTYTDYSASLTNNPYTHYWMKWIQGANAEGRNVKFDIANDYNNSLSNGNAGLNEDTYADANGRLHANANVRFMYNANTNKLKRAYLSGSSSESDLFLVLKGNESNQLWVVNSDGTKGSNHTTNGTSNWAFFKDNNNWIYQIDAYALPHTYIKLTAQMKDKNDASATQYFKGDDNAAFNDSHADLLIGGDRPGSPSENDYYKMRIIYDFKTNRLMTAWIPSALGSSDLPIHADVMLVREGQGEAQQISLNNHSLKNVHTVYAVMQFNRWKLNNRANPEDMTVSHCAREEGTNNWVYDETVTNTNHPAIAEGASGWLTQYERDLYWISFPFDVNLNEVFGSVGTYGTHWIIEYYDGKGRAQNGFWADSPSNWKFITNVNTTLKAYEGYILALDLDYFAYNNTTTWANNIQQVELYFPSGSSESNPIQITTDNLNVPFANQNEYKCQIDRRTDKTTPNTNKDRRVVDSYWHCIGTPSFHDVENTITTGENPTNPGADGNIDVPEAGYYWTPTGKLYLYEWNSDNTLSVVTTGENSKFEFKSMWSYLVQYSDASMSWINVSAAAPNAISARVQEFPDREYCFKLMRDSIEEDHTYVRLTDDANATNAFEFNYDLCKEQNAGKGNIWTVTTDVIPVAGNSMPKPVQTAVVPVGVKVVANGEYTLSMPEGTNGEDVYLIDNAYGTRTNLGLMPYTVTLTAGTYDSRFALEFAPIQDSLTSLENDANANANANADVRKVFVGGRLYIIRDGKVYDAAGQRVE